MPLPVRTHRGDKLWAGVQGTLEEAIEADLLLHVIDAASPDVANQRATVYRVLRDLGVTDGQLRSRVIEVWNKADLLEPSTVSQLPETLLADGPAVPSLEDGSDSDADWESTWEAGGNADPAVPDRQGSVPHGRERVERSIERSADTQPSPVARVDAAADDCGPSAPVFEEQRHSPATDTEADAQTRHALCAAAVSTSTLSGDGLDDLLDLLDRKLAVKLGTQELTDHTAFLGPRLLSRSVFGPRRTSPGRVAH